MELLEYFALFGSAFLPLFVAIDAIGMLPIYSNLTDGLERPQKAQVLRQAVLAGLAVSMLFLYTGPAIFRFLGITADDFRVGGGLLLLIIAMSDIMGSQKEVRRAPSLDVGVVPLGIPLIIGPAALTTTIILSNRVGYTLTSLSLIINLGLTWLVFSQADRLLRLFGRSGAKALGKVISLLLVAIAIMMIRVGIQNMLASS